MDRLLRAVTALTGLVVAGESLALLIGMHLFARAEAWMGLKNDLLAIFDVALGVVLVVLALRRGDVVFPVLVQVLILISALTHLYRGWEYLAGAGDRFFFNLPLLVFCGLRLAGLVGTLLLAYWSSQA